MHTTNTIPSGDEAGDEAGKRMPEGRRFSGDYAREMGKRGAQKRHGQASGALGHDTLLAELQSDVIQALAAKARQGNAQAARELREWLRTYAPPQDPDLDIVRLEDMTPDQRAFALAWAERQIARAARLHAALQRRPRAEEDEASQAAERPTLPPEK